MIPEDKAPENGGVALRPITEEDTPDILRWRNSGFVRSNFIWQQELPEEAHLRWMRERVETGEVVQFIILLNGLPVGSVFLRDVDHGHRKAEFGIFIGEESARGKGVGTGTARQILRHAFDEMNLHRVFLRVYEENATAIRSYEKAGFCKEGVLADDVFTDGRFRNIVLMAALNPHEANTKPEEAGPL
ncbi:GNAT family N-acetyltransferase [Ruminococcaceae bacterium OttesenSCG-928-O06]|nr:GNAT family N-acetyltransferase [Ruminococcaceae bacterium OttesenSCG-928-O06]